MAAQYLKECGFTDVMMETKSTNTAENAEFSREIAKARGLDRVVVVTHGSHAARAEMNFKSAGFEAKAAPTGFRSRMPWERGVLLFIPSHSQFNASCGALRAHMAFLWDWLKNSI